MAIGSIEEHIIHDFEAFMHDTSNVVSGHYVILFFDDGEQMKEHRLSFSRQLQSLYSHLEVFSSLYPSKRSRGAFVPSG